MEKGSEVVVVVAVAKPDTNVVVVIVEMSSVLVELKVRVVLDAGEREDEIDGDALDVSTNVDVTVRVVSTVLVLTST